MKKRINVKDATRSEAIRLGVRVMKSWTTDRMRLEIAKIKILKENK